MLVWACSHTRTELVLKIGPGGKEWWQEAKYRLNALASPPGPSMQASIGPQGIRLPQGPQILLLALCGALQAGSTSVSGSEGTPPQDTKCVANKPQPKWLQWLQGKVQRRPKVGGRHLKIV